jgi:hypothetical protein
MTCRTIGVFVTLAFTLLVAPLAADAPQATTVHRIGQLIAGNPPAGPDPSMEAFRQGLRDLGYVEGQHLVIERRSAAHDIRAGHQPEDRPGPGHHHPADAPLPGRRGAPLSREA